MSNCRCPAGSHHIEAAARQHNDQGLAAGWMHHEAPKTMDKQSAAKAVAEDSTLGVPREAGSPAAGAARSSLHSSMLGARAAWPPTCRE